MARQKEISVKEYFEKNNRKFIGFGNRFAELLSDEELITSLAQKDLEKLAKVWKLVFEMISENSGDKSAEKLTELIGAFGELTDDDQR